MTLLLLLLLKSSSISESAMSLAEESTRTRRRLRGGTDFRVSKAMLMGSGDLACVIVMAGE